MHVYNLLSILELYVAADQVTHQSEIRYSTPQNTSERLLLVSLFGVIPVF